MTVAPTTWSQSCSAQTHVRALYITSALIRLGWFGLFAFRTICFGVSVAETCLGFTQPNTTGEAWLNHHLHAFFPLRCCSKNGSHLVQKTIQPIKTSVTQQAIIKRRSDTFTNACSSAIQWERFHCVPLAVHGNKSDAMVLFNSMHADTWADFCWGQRWKISLRLKWSAQRH